MRARKLTVQRLHLPVLLFTLFLVCGCHNCFDIGCPAEFRVSFDPPLAGESIRVTLVADGKDFSCLFEKGGESEAAECDRGADMGIERSQVIGAWLNSQTPEAVSIAVTVDDEPVQEFEVTPTYGIEEPNGKGCGECTTAVVTLDMQD